MAEPHRRRMDAILDPAYLEGLEDRSVDDVRSMHEECLEVETEVSYVRRLAQARIDIVEAEIDRRARGGSLGDLVEMLPQILADPSSDHPRSAPSESRLPRHLAPPPDIEWRRGPEHLIADATLINLPTISDDELQQTLEQLRELEREVSARRHDLHRVIDRLEADLASRHKVGRA